MQELDKIQPLNGSEIERVTGGTDLPPAIGIFDWWPFGKPPWETGDEPPE
ncbi:hypothetical protein [Qipengyuania flava]|nr:hypothetical protein [Qipengyuania flava]QYJ07596.1 hypothetical protein KUV82_02410 [Qipengyuania flava]